jgi:acyl-coenzyme A thioesterase PaaI-like protein
MRNNGLNLSFHVCRDGRVEGRFRCGYAYQGYTGLLHGGVISSILDGAMTNCLFSSGKTAVTAKNSGK